MELIMSKKLLIILASLALIAAACGGGSSGDASSGDASSDDAQGPSMAASSPIGAFFNEDGGFDEAIEEFSVKVEEGISICMAEQGFEFARTGNGGFNDPATEAQSELTIRQWTKEYGYGVSTSFESALNQNASDPNAEIVFGMGEEERNQWLFALTGQEGFGGLQGGGQDIALEEQGCIGQSLIATGAEDVFEGLESFGNAYEEQEDALFDRREMVDAVDAWSRCLSEGGYDNYAEPDAPEAEILTRFQAILAPYQAELNSIDPDEGAAIFSGDSVDAADLPGLDIDALRTLQDDELATALADLDCYDEHVKDIYEPLRDDFERGLMTEYQTELDSLKNIGS